MIDTPQAALAAMRAALKPVGERERMPLAAAVGRVLAEDQRTDRPSPPADVSAMDGYALRQAEFAPSLPVAATATPGHPPLTLPAGAAIKITTGACLPIGADTVIKREDTEETAGRVQFRLSGAPPVGQFIRRAGENGPAGTVVAPAGSRLTAAMVSALAATGVSEVSVVRRVRVAVLTTGDELVPPGLPMEPHQIRDSNGPALAALFGAHPWAEVLAVQHVRDDLAALTGALERAVAGADAVLLTGGVSMGDFDHVPAAAAGVGARTLFHKLPTRPGKPLFAACRGNTPIIGLPGNPLSVLTTARWFALPALSHLAGLPPIAAPQIALARSDTQTLPLHWFRLVRQGGDGSFHLLDAKSSGDLLTVAGSAGFVHQLPNTPAEGLLPFYAW